LTGGSDGRIIAESVYGSLPRYHEKGVQAYGIRYSQRHLLVFEKLLASFPITYVLEFGMGRYSTPFFVERCRSVVSVEQEDRARYDETVAQVKSARWEPFFECNPATVFEHFEKQSRKFDLVFSDGVPQTRSMIANLAMRKGIPFVVLHDAEKVWDYRCTCWIFRRTTIASTSSTCRRTR